MVFNMLKGGQPFVTVIGTPDTWHSFVYLYFVHRYRAEQPNATIITASFNDTHAMSECRVLLPGSNDGIFHSTIPILTGDVVYFYDGPPDLRPPRGAVTVCFMDYDYTWQKNMRYALTHECVFTPTWSLAELLEANELLDLRVSARDIRNRYAIVGGVPAVCFSADLSEVCRAYERVMACVKAIRSYHDLDAFLFGMTPVSCSIYPLFHHLPMTESGKRSSTYSATFASKFVLELVAQRTAGSNGERSLRFSMDHSAEIEGLRAWLDRCTGLSK